MQNNPEHISPLVIHMKDRTKLFWLLHSAGWLILGLLYLFLYYRDYLQDPVAVISVMITYAAGFVVTLGLRRVYRKLMAGITGIGYLVLMLIAGSLISAQIWLWTDLLVSLPLQGYDQLIGKMTPQTYLSFSFSRSTPILIWSILYILIKVWFEWNAQKEQTARADALAHRAQLQMLRYQLNPHFLFNALNSIRALIDEDHKSAREMVTELAEFLRYSLISRQDMTVPLTEELRALEHYFKIEKKRFEEKLVVRFEVDPAAGGFMLPSFLLHPLVENAVKYGMKTSTMPLRIAVTVAIKEDVLILEVTNSGRWQPAESSGQGSTGTGLENVRQRLEYAFPGRHSFEILNRDEMVGVRIKITGYQK